MTNTQYLYGDSADPSQWAKLPYDDALRLKIKLAYNTITELHKAHYMVTDSSRIRECTKAMSFNEDLLKELK